MNLTSIGDLAHDFMLRRQNVQLRGQMAQLTQELSTGQAADLTRHLSGRVGYVATIERDLVVLDSHRIAATEAGISAAAMQLSLERVHDQTGDVSAVVLGAVTSAGPTGLTSVATQAKGSLDAMMAALNADIAGRSLFTGSEVDAAALVSADQLLSDLRSAVGGATTAAGVMAAAEGFFDTPGGGFETLTYQGGATGLTPYQLGSGESVSLDLRADDPTLREVLKHVALAALVDDPALSVAAAEKPDMLRQISDGLLAGQDGVTRLRADLGFAEARIDQAATRIAAEMTGLQITRNELVSVDRFETATELEAVQLQLETLYAATARASRLSLVNFLS